jgi:hypothetical protein
MCGATETLGPGRPLLSPRSKDGSVDGRKIVNFCFIVLAYLVRLRSRRTLLRDFMLVI